MLTASLLSLSLALSPSVSPDAAGPQELSSSDLKDQIDRSVRWLRSRFDVEARSYGSLEEDAQALLALAASPRAYRAADGPFVAGPLGRLTKAVETGLDEPRLALIALAALEELGGAETAPLRTRLRRELGEVDRNDPFVGLDAAALQARAREALAARGAEGAWGEGDARFLETARQVHHLGELYRRLKRHETGSAPLEATPLPAVTPADRARVEKALVRGVDYLFDQTVEGRWGFGGRPDPGITAMVLASLAGAGERLSDEQRGTTIEALDWLVSLQKPDGSIHDGAVANYVTSVAILALTRFGREADVPVVERARRFLVGLQADEGEGYSSGDTFYGGVGYGGDERPDLSNLQMALEALAASGSKPGDETFAKALTFLQRCQNRTETNDLTLERDGVTFVSGNDGGSGYAPGESKAGFVELADGRRVPRSYGSMTYALLKGYLFAGLSKGDPRVEAAWKWLRENYTLDVNPGFQASSDPTAAYQGLFYYFYTMAKALDLYGEETVVDGAGVAHPWRTELAGRLLAMQRQDGSWINANAPRWYEGNPVLATAYALQTLTTALGAER